MSYAEQKCVYSEKKKASFGSKVGYRGCEGTLNDQLRLSAVLLMQ